MLVYRGLCEGDVSVYTTNLEDESEYYRCEEDVEVLV